MLRPFFTYYGGKWRAALSYPRPVFQTIVEPFAGSAGYSTRHHKRRVVLVDKDPHIVGVWSYLIRESAAAIRALPDVPPEGGVDSLGVCQEARWLIGFWLNKGAAAPCKTPSKWMRGGTHTTSFWGSDIRERIASQVDKIRHWKIIDGSYHDAPRIEATWFIDPPYEQAGKHYRCGADDIDFADLASWCQTLMGQAIVCENAGASWLPFGHHASIKSTGGTSNEAVWYSGPQSLQTWLPGSEPGCSPREAADDAENLNDIKAGYGTRIRDIQLGKQARSQR